MLAKVFGSALIGIEAITVTIEVNIDSGIGYHLVGLPDNAIRESNYRIAAALLHNGYRIPGKKVTINMAPADLRKEGAAYDLSIALGILLASGQIRSDRQEEYLVMGELALDGRLHPIKGALPIALKARQEGFRGVILPASNAGEAAVVEGLEVFGVASLTEVIGFFKGAVALEPCRPVPFGEASGLSAPAGGDFNDVRGQETVKRCMEIAAAGGHNVVLIGPPGSGKTMLAKRLAGILPPMTLDEALETTKIHSITGSGLQGGLIRNRPFRCPHHTISDVALVGGGSYPQPGEISLAHNGVLFLDELPEFKRHVLEVMRQPLEEGQVTISRSRFTVTYPSHFMLVASMNPSPGGYFAGENNQANTPADIRRYLSRVSGPLLDRIDIHMEVSPVPYEKLSEARKGESSRVIRERVTAARQIQHRRFAGTGTHCNAQMEVRQIRKFCTPAKGAATLLGAAMERLQLSARAYDRILKVARTIADLEQASVMGEAHIAEAIQYRSLDREGWMG